MMFQKLDKMLNQVVSNCLVSHQLFPVLQNTNSLVIKNYSNSFGKQNKTEDGFPSLKLQ